MQAPLSYEQAPPFSAPLRYFLTAPWFGMAAGLVLLIVGPDLFVSRWMPATLAVTHLLTLGFMLMIMLGALIQILPVVMGVKLRWERAVTRTTHLGLSLGTVLLALAFLFGGRWLFVGACVALGGAVSLFLVSAANATWQVLSATTSIKALKLSLIGLAGTLALGLSLALGLVNSWTLPYFALADLHAAWGFAAWSAVLLAALAYVVLPMFQMTPAYPVLLATWFPRMVLGLLLLWSLGQAMVWDWLVLPSVLGLVLVVGGFILHTLYLQTQRRRARQDPTFLFWRFGLVCAFLALVLLGVMLIFPTWGEGLPLSMLFGILLGVGGYISLMVGMLYKIVPFLAWLHLQDLGRARRKVPSMSKLLPEQSMQHQMWIHMLTLGLLVAAVFWPVVFARLAGLGLVASNLYLFCNLFAVSLSYRRETLAASNFAAGNASNEG